MGFTMQDHSSDAMEVLKKLRPSSATGSMRSFSSRRRRRSISRVVDKLIVGSKQLDKNGNDRLDPAAREWVAKRGYDKKWARDRWRA